MQVLPQNSRNLASFFNGICKRWSELSAEEKASGEFINPDKPVVLCVPNHAQEPGLDERENLYFHVLSAGGNCEEDESAHDGAELGGTGI